MFYFFGLTFSVVAGKIVSRFSETFWQNSLILLEADCKRGKHISDHCWHLSQRQEAWGYPLQNKPVDLEYIMKETISWPCTDKGWLVGIKEDLFCGEGIKSQQFLPVHSLLLGRRKGFSGCLSLPRKSC